MTDKKDVNDNFLNYNWWKTASLADVKAENIKGVNINAKDNYECSAILHAAAFSENPEISKTLLDFGADIYAKAQNGRTVLDYAEKNKNPEVLKLLKKYYTK